MLGGPGPTRYLAPRALIFDLGGGAAYLAGAGGNGGQPSTFALAIDPAGDDVYEAQGGFSLAAGALGGGILIDLGGDDLYRSARPVAQGRAWGGGLGFSTRLGRMSKTEGTPMPSGRPINKY